VVGELAQLLLRCASGIELGLEGSALGDPSVQAHADPRRERSVRRGDDQSIVASDTWAWFDVSDSVRMRPVERAREATTTSTAVDITNRLGRNDTLDRCHSVAYAAMPWEGGQDHAGTGTLGVCAATRFLAAPMQKQ
jgi:hypothetical protein